MMAPVLWQAGLVGSSGRQEQLSTGSQYQMMVDVDIWTTIPLREHWQATRVRVDDGNDGFSVVSRAEQLSTVPMIGP
jgi:hypothetical protein